MKNNNAKVKKWLKENYKNDRLIFNKDTNLICNGYVVKRVDSFMMEEIEKIRGSYESFDVVKGRDFGTILNIQKLIDNMDEEKFPCMDTKFVFIDKDNRELKVFHSQNSDGEDVFVYANKEMFDLFYIDEDNSMSGYRKAMNINSAIFIINGGNFEGLIMPIRMYGYENNYKLTVR